MAWTVPDLADELRRRIATDPTDVLRGQLAGMTTDAPAPLRRDSGEMSDDYRAGFFAGRIYEHLARESSVLPDEVLLTAGIYGASLAQGAVEGRFEGASAHVVVAEHTAACLRIAWKGLRLGQQEEAALFAWLTDVVGLAVDDELRAAYARARERRLQRIASGRRE